MGLAAHESGRAEPVERAHKKVPVAGDRQVDRDQIFDLDVEARLWYLQTRAAPRSRTTGLCSYVVHSAHAIGSTMGYSYRAGWLTSYS